MADAGDDKGVENPLKIELLRSGSISITDTEREVHAFLYPSQVRHLKAFLSTCERIVIK